MAAKVVKSYKQRGTVKHVLFSLPVPGTNDEDDDLMTYKVRALSPTETYENGAIVDALEPPIPPVKERTVVPPGGKLDAGNIQQEEYDDYHDPTFLEEIKIFKHQKKLHDQRATMHSLMLCVDTFNLTDEEIKAELDEDAHAREPLDELMLRLDQVSEIIMTDFDIGHMIALRQKINQLSGVSAELVNFT